MTLIILINFVIILFFIGIATGIFYLFLKKLKKQPTSFYAILKAILLYDFIIFLLLLAGKDIFFYRCLGLPLDLLVAIGTTIISFLLFAFVARAFKLLHSFKQIIAAFITIALILNLISFVGLFLSLRTATAYASSTMELPSKSLSIELFRSAFLASTWNYLLHLYEFKLITCRRVYTY